MNAKAIVRAAAASLTALAAAVSTLYAASAEASAAPAAGADAIALRAGQSAESAAPPGTPDSALSARTSPIAGPPDYKRALPTAEVLIDAGHGGIDGGAHFGGVLEKDINLKVAKRLYLVLRSQGIPAVLNRTGDYALSDDNRWHHVRSRHRRDLSQRKGLADEIDIRLLVSLHVNWSDNPSASGPLVLHQNEGRSALLAFFLQDALNREYGSRRLPKVGAPYYLLNLVRRPAVIVELGFLSSAADRAKLTDPRWQQRLAEAVAAGIRQYLWTAG